MIYECFYFWDELDLLDVKLHELSGVVDKFVLLEFPTSLRHISQPLQYEANKERYKEFEDKIIHIIGPDDNRQFNGLDLLFRRHRHYLDGLQNCSPDDIIILSSPDVIWKRQTIEQIKTLDLEKGSIQFFAEWYCYYLDFYCTEIKYGFDGACLYKDLKYHNPNNEITIPIAHSIDNAGWHFAKLGGVDRILSNLHGYPHLDMDNSNTHNREIMQMKMEKGYAWGATGDYRKVMKYVPFCAENYPEYIVNHPEIYGKYFRNRE